MTIHLDTNVLIAFVGGDAARLAPLREPLKQGAATACSALAWFGFLCGPSEPAVSDEELDRASALIGGTVIPVDGRTASLAARLFNQTGRRRGSQSDCLVAATALASEADLFTLNVADFEPFESLGLRLLH